MENIINYALYDFKILNTKIKMFKFSLVQLFFADRDLDTDLDMLFAENTKIYLLYYQ